MSELNQRWGQPLGLQGGRTGLSSFDIYGMGKFISVAAITTSTVWPAANLAIFVPFSLDSETLIAQLWWFNGATVAGNVDIGIYTADGTRLLSAGSTAQSGTSVLQSVNTADTLVGPGVYYLALALSDGTATISGRTLAALQHGQIAGMAEKTSAFALPATVTLASLTGLFCPAMGVVGKETL